MHSTRPTRVRYLIVLLTTLAAVLLYLDRFCISFAERYIKEDLDLSNEQIGWILSAFFWTYALAQVPSGFLTDRFGARLMLTVYILLWSAFTGLTGLAAGFLALVLLRFGFGIAQAGAYPASASLISKWVPFPVRGLASSMVATGGRIGGFIAPLVTAALIVAFVPHDASARLTLGDIRDLPHLCYKLANHPAQANEQLLATWSNEGSSAVAVVAGRYARAVELSREKGTSLADAVARTGPAPTQGEVGQILAGLNGLLERRDLASFFNVKEMKLPDEAERLLEIPASQLSQAQLLRRNRLLLETAFPDGIKKLYRLGWRGAMLAFGLVGIAVGLLFLLLFRDRPALHPWCNPAEVHLVESSRPAGAPSPHGKANRVPLRRLAGSLSMWLMCLAQFGTNVGWIFLVTWLPRYLDEVHRLPIGLRGVLASVPLLCGWFGMLLGGGFTDWFTRRIGPRWGRALPIAVSRLVAMAAYGVCLFEPNLWTAMLAFCLVSFATDFGIPAMWAFNLDVGGRYVGSVLGWGNMWGNFGAALSPPLLNWVVGHSQWQHAFLACGLAFLLSGLCSLGINANVPVVPDEETVDEAK